MRNTNLKIKPLILSFGILFSVWANGQTKPKDTLDLRGKRLGVVLSGGSARGLAHIGFLKALEEKGIYPSYISGTSIGALVGGMYAAGYSADQLDTIFKSINYNTIFTDHTTKSFVNILEKVQQKPLQIPFTLDSTFRFNLPTGLSDGQNLLKNLAMYTHHLDGNKDFDSLSIPFLAIGTDLKNMKVVEINSGNLAYAMRASSSLPSVFSPFDYQNKTLIDGGILNNIPIKETREKNQVDYIISHNVNRKLDTTNFPNIGNLFYRLTTIKREENNLKQFPYGDFNIRTDPSRMGVTSFSNIDSIISLGYHNTKQNLKQFKFVGELPKFKIQKIPEVTDKIKVHKVTVNHQAISERMKAKLFFEENSAVEFEQINKTIDYLYSEYRYNSVAYEYYPKDSLLNFRLIPKRSNDKLFLGGFYNTDYGINLDIGIDLRDFWIEDSRFTSSWNIGQLPSFNTKFYLDNGVNFGFGTDMNIQSIKIRVYNPITEGPTFKEYRGILSNFKIYAMNRYKSYGLVKYGIAGKINNYQYDYFNSSNEINTRNVNNNSSYLFADFYFDNLDKLTYPRSGTKVRLSAKTYIYLENEGNFFVNPKILSKETLGSFRKDLEVDNFQVSLEYQQVLNLFNSNWYLKFHNQTNFILSKEYAIPQLTVIGGYAPSGVMNDFAIPFDGLSLDKINSINSSYLINKLDLYYNWRYIHNFGVSYHQGFFFQMKVNSDNINEEVYKQSVDYHSISAHYGVDVLGVPIGFKWAKNLKGGLDKSSQFFFHISYNLW